MAAKIAKKAMLEIAIFPFFLKEICTVRSIFELDDP